jgi:hypothetical protein
MEFIQFKKNFIYTKKNKKLKVLKTYEQYSGGDKSDIINESVKELQSLIGKELKFRTITYRGEITTDDKQDFSRRKIRFGVIRQIIDWDLYSEPMIVVECDDRTYRLTYDTKKDRFHIYRYYMPNKVVGVDPTDIEILEKLKQHLWGQIIEIEKRFRDQ